MKKQRNPVATRRKVVACAITTLFATLFAGVGHAEDKLLGTVNVSADSVEGSWIQPEHGSPQTVYRVGGDALRLYDSPGGANPYTAVAEIPGVKITSVDPWGLNNMQGGQKGMRVRGEVSTHGVSGTVEGLALGGPGPGPGYLFLFDKENLAGISFAQGAVAADRAGLFNTYGALDSQLLWPRAEAHREVSASYGSDHFQRLFGRIDSGELSSGTALFLSASDTSADKWRGYGKAPSGRSNVELGLSQKLGNLGLKVVYANNEQSQNNYKALTYTQATSGNYGYDYANNPASSDHYDYNRQDFHSQVLLAELEYAFSPQTSVVFKPYLAKEDGYYLYAGSTPTQVFKWLIDHETYGYTGELKTVLANTDIKLGYSWTSTEPPGPPTNRQQYQVVNGKLVFQQWAMLSNVVDRHEFENLYFTGQRRFDALTVQGGARYARETLPGIDAYKAAAATAGTSWDVSADNALSRAVKDPTRSVQSRSFGYWLPQVGIGYEFNPALEVHGNLGRNIGAPAFDVFNLTPAGKITTSQGYWDQLRPELSTSLDLGSRLRFGNFYADPTVYFSRSANKSVSVFNVDSNTVWSQNIGNTRARGVQLAAGWVPSDSLRVFGAFSYSESYFVEDVRTAGGALLPVVGRQLPDIPKVMANLGTAWRSQGFTVAPMLQYVGSRWANTTYTEKMPEYVTADLTLSYGQKSAWGKWEASLAVLNAFDRKYIGQISTSEVNTTANGAIYYPGAPRTFAAKLSLDF